MAVRNASSPQVRAHELHPSTDMTRSTKSLHFCFHERMSHLCVECPPCGGSSGAARRPTVAAQQRTRTSSSSSTAIVPTLLRKVTSAGRDLSSGFRGPVDIGHYRDQVVLRCGRQDELACAQHMRNIVLALVLAQRRPCAVGVLVVAPPHPRDRYERSAITEDPGRRTSNARAPPRHREKGHWKH